MTDAQAIDLLRTFHERALSLPFGEFAARRPT
jgi:hypothetical protein